MGSSTTAVAKKRSVSSLHRTKSKVTAKTVEEGPVDSLSAPQLPPPSKKEGLRTSSLPKRLEQTTAQMAPLLSQTTTKSAAHLAASKELGQVVSRQSLAALYELAYALRRTTPMHSSSAGSPGSNKLIHSAPLPYYAPRVETSAEKRTTSDQIWGQMNVLLRPVLRRLQDRVREAQKVLGEHSGGGAISSSGTASRSRNAASRRSQRDAEAEGSEDTKAERKTPGTETPTSEWSEGELDEEIHALLREAQQSRRKGAQSTRKEKDVEGGEDSAWRYAFGKGNVDDELSDDAEGRDEAGNDGAGGRHGEDAWDDADEEERVNSSKTNQKHKKSNGLGDEDEDEDLAALKEMYGDDFEDDGEGFLGDEEEGEDGEEGEEKEDEDDDHPRDLYREQDGQFHGYDDILDDPQGMFDDRGEDGDPTAVDRWGEGDDAGSGATRRVTPQDELDAELAKDEELQAFLQRTDVSELEKDRLLEKKKVHLMEQRRLHGVNQWAMAGESSASKRPREALLELDQLDFEYGMKSVPVITEAVTLKLEERIKQRILDKQFDNVTRRVEKLSSAEDLAAMTKRAEAQKHSQEAEKSKLSLMDLYEKEFLEKQRMANEAAGEGPSAEPLTNVERDELRAIQMWKRLSQHLDALSNFHFTPKPVRQDLEARVRAVEGQAPALVMEAVGNFAANRESALAPQDTYRSKSRLALGEAGLLVGSAELDPKERRALRRKRKEIGAVKKQIVEQNKRKHQKEAKERKNVVAAAASASSSKKK